MGQTDGHQTIAYLLFARHSQTRSIMSNSRLFLAIVRCLTRPSFLTVFPCIEFFTVVGQTDGQTNTSYLLDTAGGSNMQ